MPFRQGYAKDIESPALVELAKSGRKRDKAASIAKEFARRHSAVSRKRKGK